MSKKKQHTTDFVEQFFDSIDDRSGFLEMFDLLPDIYVYIKDRKSRFVHANEVVCKVVGATELSEVVGKSDFDFFPPAIAAQYVAEDQRVIESGAALYKQVWIVPGNDGVPRLYSCSKIPLLNRQGAVGGIAGIKRPFEYSTDNSTGFNRLMHVIAFVTENYAQEIEVGDLARQAGISISQLQREFSKQFGISPNRYIREVRIGVARHLLSTSDESLTNIAASCGFYDQSHFHRHFKTMTGLTPADYRDRYFSESTT